MDICGIVSEYNPFHSGHQCQIRETKNNLNNCAVVAVMSGNYVQRAQPTIFDKWCRAKAAILGGVNLVIELPTVYAVSGAQNFASSSVEILNRLGCISHISFGSESGDLSLLQNTAKAILSPETDAEIAAIMKSGNSYAYARENAVSRLFGKNLSACLQQPNNILAIEYLKALSLSSSPIQPFTVKRNGSGYHDASLSNGHISATAARLLLEAERFEKLSPYLSKEILSLYLMEHRDGKKLNSEKFQITLLTALRRLSSNDYLKLPDVSEGIQERIITALINAVSVDDLCKKVSTKRYPISRIRRIILCAFLGITKEMTLAPSSYIRVLAFDETGRSILKIMQHTCLLPIIVKTADMPSECVPSFQFEAMCTDVYMALTDVIQPCGLEFTTSPYYMK